MKQLKVNITQENIDNAVEANSKRCMIADAIIRDYGKKLKNVVVDREVAAMSDRKTGTRYTFRLTPLGRASLLLFDDGQKPKPFTMTLRRPVIRHRLPGSPTQGEIRSGRKVRPLDGDGPSPHIGAVPLLRSKTGRVSTGRDRFFGKKVFTNELVRMREQLGIGIEPSVIP